MGQIMIDDDFKDWEWFSDRNTLSVFMYLLLNANTEDKKDRGIDVPRGSVKVTMPELMECFGMSLQEVRTSVKHLKATGKITGKQFNKGTVFTVVDYDSYSVANRQNNRQTTGKQQAKT